MPFRVSETDSKQFEKASLFYVHRLGEGLGLLAVALRHPGRADQQRDSRGHIKDTHLAPHVVPDIAEKQGSCQQEGRQNAQTEEGCSLPELPPAAAHSRTL